jgi:hypothetical protein
MKSRRSPVPAWVSINASLAGRAGLSTGGPHHSPSATVLPVSLAVTALLLRPAFLPGVLTRNRNEKENDHGT